MLLDRIAALAAPYVLSAVIWFSDRRAVVFLSDGRGATGLALFSREGGGVLLFDAAAGGPGMRRASEIALREYGPAILAARSRGETITGRIRTCS